MLIMTTSEARRDLSEVIRKVRKGERAILKKHDKPVAALISIADLKRLRALEDQNDLMAAREALKEAEEVSWEELKAELGL